MLVHFFFRERYVFFCNVCENKILHYSIVDISNTCIIALQIVIFIAHVALLRLTQQGSARYSWNCPDSLRMLRFVVFVAYLTLIKTSFYCFTIVSINYIISARN